MVKLRIGKLTNSPKSKLPFFSAKISAGFPSPADDHVERKLDLHELLVEHEAATFFVEVEGTSMIDANIHPGDILIVDKALTPKNNSIIIAILNGEFTVKRIKMEGSSITLMPENPKYKPLPITKDMDFEIWGVVTYTIHDVRARRL